jgi:putative flippase GtrA
VFLRYCAGSLLTFATDYLIFVSVFAQTSSLGLGIVCARTGSTFVSFIFNRQAVFHAHGRIATALLRFIALVAGLGWIAYLATSYLARAAAIPVVYAKLLVEGLLFFAGFALNNVFVFDRPARESALADADDAMPGVSE